MVSSTEPRFLLFSVNLPNQRVVHEVDHRGDGGTGRRQSGRHGRHHQDDGQLHFVRSAMEAGYRTKKTMRTITYEMSYEMAGQDAASLCADWACADATGPVRF